MVDSDWLPLAVELLRGSGADLTPGLTDDEFTGVEHRFGIRFGADHRRLLARVLPVGPRWVDWRSTPANELLARLDGPIAGVLFDVEAGGFWSEGWGPRPIEPAARRAQARAELRAAPRLIPIYAHRYLPMAPANGPVFSVHQTDVIVYGANVLDYLRHEFGPALSLGVDGSVGIDGSVGVDGSATPGAGQIPFWSKLAG
jgi:hypothetical protein